MGDDKILDGMIFDGLWDPYSNVHMGHCGDACAKEYGISREVQDAYAKESFRRALLAQKELLFADEIEPVLIPQRKGEPLQVAIDEGPGKADISKMGALKPAFGQDGTITAANASSINDGASALLLASDAALARYGLESMARIAGYAGAAQAPDRFTTAPSLAIDRLLEKRKLQSNNVDLYEINEAFAVVALVAMKLNHLHAEQVNVHGGAVALGHPIGASGARILTTLVHAMRNRKAKRGIASICIGGGEAIALCIER